MSDEMAGLLAWARLVSGRALASPEVAERVEPAELDVLRWLLAHARVPLVTHGCGHSRPVDLVEDWRDRDSDDLCRRCRPSRVNLGTIILDPSD